MDISGKDINELHSLNIPFIPYLPLTLEVIHVDISGNDINDFHPENIKSILLTLNVFHVDISGNEIKDSQS